MICKLSVCRLLVWLVIVVLIAMVILALTADFLGLDSDLKWGPFRKGILLVGLAGLTIPVLLKVINTLDRQLMDCHGRSAPRSRRNASRTFFATWPIGSLRKLGDPANQAIDRSDSLPRRGPGGTPEGEVKHGLRFEISRIARKQHWLALMLTFVLVEFLYVGFVTVWHWTTWPSTSRYYAMLADSFTQGQTALPIEPSPLLAELENPYFPDERKGIPVIGDLSYYQGRYFMYWGPAPAALLAGWKLLGGRLMGDVVILFFAISAIFLFSMLILLYLRKRFFEPLPNWLLAASVAIVATSHPILWTLNSSNIYEAAISSGQAFLIAGLYFALPILDGSRTGAWRYGLVGLLWVFAVGSRLTLLGAVLVLTTGVLLMSYSHSKHLGGRAFITSAMALVVALMIGAGLLARYNYIRFDNILETGIRYQITGTDLGVQIDQGRFFNAAYLPPNLLYYLVAPIRVISDFPFIRPHWEAYPVFTAYLTRLRVPNEWGIESVAGLIFAMPTFVLAGFLGAELLCGERSLVKRTKQILDPESDSDLAKARGILGIILLAGFVAAVPAFFYTFLSTRFLMDFVPLFALLAAVGAWRLYFLSRPYPIRRRVTNLLIIGTVAVATIVSFLLALSGAYSRFDDLNPELYAFLQGLFSR